MFLSDETIGGEEFARKPSLLWAFPFHEVMDARVHLYFVSTLGNHRSLTPPVSILFVVKVKLVPGDALPCCRFNTSDPSMELEPADKKENSKRQACNPSASQAY